MSTVKIATLQHDSTVRAQVAAEEWQTRVDLAAAYRLVAHYGWDDRAGRSSASPTRAP